MNIQLTSSHVHSHLLTRMVQRGITLQDIETTLNNGWDAEDAVVGTLGKVFVFEFNNEWQGKYYHEKEVTVYFKYDRDELIVLTAIARYGNSFERKN